MAEGGQQFLTDSTVLVSAAELAEVVGIDLETVNNWLRRGVISRAPIGGRQLRHRLFSSEQVYRAALTHELVKLGLPPSSASESIEELWKQWHKKRISDGENVFGIISTLNSKWTALLCWQKTTGGPLFRIGSKAEEIEFSKSACVVLPMSSVCARVAEKLANLLDGKKKRATKK